MSSPPRDPVLSSSPISNTGGSPVLRRRESISQTDAIDRPRLSPNLARSYDPNDPQVRERQRTMDVDMAMQLSRARRETLPLSPTTPSYEHAHTSPDVFDSMLSPHEQHEIDIARGELNHLTDHPGRADEEVLHFRSESSIVDLHPHLHQAHDPSLLVSQNTLGAPNAQCPPMDDPSTSAFGLPTYQANASRSNFDFGLMEEFAVAEKASLGIPSTRFDLNSFNPRNVAELGANQTVADGPSNGSTSSLRPARHRKLSQSNPNPRIHRKGVGGKMALFEGNAGEPLPSLPSRIGVGLSGQGMLSAVPSFENLVSGDTPGPTGILNAGHDRPYRFSFYSNALSATIHARSLSELPADGQSFEDLFAGVGAFSPEPEQPNSKPGDNFKRAGTGPNAGRKGIASEPTNPNAYQNNNSYFPSGKGGAGGYPRNGMTGGMVGGDSDVNTWWLDIQSPTDEEMKMLSKVFSIHPLTTEDIQMEEAREKIELFRNYYLVCFRSFDQDPYSPTHLEPLNMYIIVFREGTLSFHFRPTPHPQNVRRRIKQLKDYISVTSDWISYALIDDITDAFGPLIQGIEYEVDSIDELVLILKEAEQTDMLRRIGTCRKKVMGLLRLMGNKADVVKGLAKRCNENWRVAPTSDIGLYLSDIQDHLITMTQNLNHYEKILSRSHSNYLAQISIEMTDANNQINDVLSKLTALGTVLIPMNLITGLWGMNVHVPGQNVPGYAWFVSIIAGLAAFAFIGGYSTYKFMVKR